MLFGVVLKFKNGYDPFLYLLTKFVPIDKKLGYAIIR